MTEAQQVSLTALGGSLAETAQIAVLAHEDVHACNTFENPEAVVPAYGELNLSGSAVITVPAAGVVSVTVRRA